MVEAIIYDKRKIIAVCAPCNGEYGIKDLFMGVPVILGKNGIEEVLEIELSAGEKAALTKSAQGVRATCNEADELLKSL